MSTVRSPLASSPRKGKHMRAGGFTLSQSTSASHDSFSRISASTLRGQQSSSSSSSMPLGIDPMTLDADDAFVRLGVREIQVIEASLHATHEQLSARLRTLVSERYRDMLGTANTLIEMSTSSSNLVNRLDAVRQGVEKARSARAGGRESVTLTNGVSVAQPHDAMVAGNILAIAAATKLLAESPDNIWRAIDAASWTNTVGTSGKQKLRGRRLGDYKAAIALRAVWTYILCQEAWTWLSQVGSSEVDEHVDLHSLFPHITSQWHAIASMRSSLADVCRAGTTGWFATEDIDVETRWESVSSSYTATLTFSLALSLLEEASISTARDILLSTRREAIVKRLRTRSLTLTTALSHLVRSVADTMIHILRAFIQPNSPSGSSHIAEIFAATISSKDGIKSESSFPPTAMQILSTLPSAAAFIEYLPKKIQCAAPKLSTADSLQSQQETARVLRGWCASLRQEGEQDLFVSTISAFENISSIGETQIKIRQSSDSSVRLAQKVFGSTDPQLSLLVETEVKALAEQLEDLLLKRLDTLYRERTTQLSLAISQSVTAALQALSGEEKSEPSNRHIHESVSPTLLVEKQPVRFMFDTESKTSTLENKLRLQTPLLQSIISSLEQRARLLTEEMDTYSAFVRRDLTRRTKKRSKQNGTIASPLEYNDEGTHRTKVDHVFRADQDAFDAARLTLVTSLKEHVRESDSLERTKNASGTQLVFIARVASALQHTSLHGTGSSHSDRYFNDDKHFIEQLKALQQDVFHRWVAQVSANAIKNYPEQAASCFDSLSDEQCRPTQAFTQALLHLVEGIHAVGCGNQSEAIALGQQMMHAFIRLWLQLADKVDGQVKALYNFDTLALLLMSREYEGLGEEVEKLSQIAKLHSMDSLDGVETALQRLRLVLLPLRGPRAVAHAQQKADKAGLPEQFVSAPPLPMLSLIKGRDKVALL